jgi:hypothetical protein
MARNLQTLLQVSVVIRADRYKVWHSARAADLTDITQPPPAVPQPIPPPGRGKDPETLLAVARPGQDPPGAARPPRHLADLDPGERRAVAEQLGERSFRGDQLSRHYFARLTEDPGDMTDVPASARVPLAEALLPRLLTAEREFSCDQGQTRKTLWRAFDGAYVESVLMRYPERVTICVSSQAGCGMACPFCATGQAGLTRNLSAAEIVAQVVAGARALAQGEVPGGPGRISNVVFMGMGEPLANYSRVLAAVRRITDRVPEGLGISRRGVTISTVGLVPAIARRVWGGDRAPGLDRVRADPRDQRSGLASRGARQAAFWSARPREPDPAEPHAGVDMDGVGSRGDAGIREPAGAAGHSGDRPRHQGNRDRRGLRSACRQGGERAGEARCHLG